MASAEDAFIAKEFRIFNYKQADVIQRRLCDGNFWTKMAEDRAKMEFDYYRRLNDWCGSYKNANFQQDGIYSENIQTSLWKEDLDVSCARLNLALETGELYEKLSEELKKENVSSTTSMSYTSVLQKYKMTLKTYQIKTKGTKKAKQKYESKQQTLKTYEAAYRPNYQNMGGKINKMKASVDISKKLYQYRQLEETAARQHLLMSSGEIQGIWQSELEQKLETIVDKWKNCIASVQDVTNSIMKNISNEDSIPFIQDHDRNKIRSALDFVVTDKLFMTIDLEEQDVDISLNADETFPFRRAGSQISVITEQSCNSLFGSETDSIEEVDFDCARIGENNKNRYNVYFPRIFGESASNGWLQGLQDEECPNESGTKQRKAYGFKVKAIKEYVKHNHKEISLKPGQYLRQMFPANETGYAFGYKRNKFHKRYLGYFPASHVQVV